MCAKTDRLGFLRYLKDEKFIEWKLLSSDELSAYWEEYLKNNPDEAHLTSTMRHPNRPPKTSHRKVERLIYALV